MQLNFSGGGKSQKHGKLKSTAGEEPRRDKRWSLSMIVMLPGLLIYRTRLYSFRVCGISAKCVLGGIMRMGDCGDGGR